MSFKPGIIPNMLDADYRAAAGINYSALKEMARSPKHVKFTIEKKDEEEEERETWNIGHAAEQMIVWSRLPETFVIGKWENYRSAEAKNWREEMVKSGRKTLMPSSFEKVKKIRRAVLEHPAAGPLVQNIIPKVGVFSYWETKAGKVARKSQIDAASNEFHCLLDVKTTDDASPHQWRKRCTDLKYHVQASYYTDGFQTATEEKEPRTMVFIVVERDEPHDVGVYQLDKAAIETGRLLWTQWIEKYAACCVSKHWPGICDKLIELSLPSWAHKDLPI